MVKDSPMEHFLPVLLRICDDSLGMIYFRSAMSAQQVSWQFATTVLVGLLLLRIQTSFRVSLSS